MTDTQILIGIDWPYALGIFGGLIALAWYGSSRIKAVETDVGWLKKTSGKIENKLETIESKLSDLTIISSNDEKKSKIFNYQSPIELTSEGQKILTESGLGDYLNNPDHRSKLDKICQPTTFTNPYEIQQYIFDKFNTISFEPEFDDKLKNYAYSNGLTMDLLRRVGAIYFRDKCLQEHNMSSTDIDKHHPDKTQNILQ